MATPPAIKSNPIEHVVLLMLENRSFDSLLGWLYEDSQPLHHLPELPSGARAFDGLQGLDLATYTNTDATGKIAVQPTRGAQGLNIPNIAPSEEFSDVNVQLFGTKTPYPGSVPSMQGYVRDYAARLKQQAQSDEDVQRCVGQVMQSYTPDQVPVLAGLARHYAVSDRWFSSVPSQTNPNRAFAMCGTSMGLVDNGYLEENKLAAPLEKLIGYKLGDDRFHAPTVFNALAKAGASWKVYRKSGLLQNNVGKAALIIETILNSVSLPAGISAAALINYLIDMSSMAVQSDYTHRLFPQIGLIPDADKNFEHIDEFFVAAQEGRLPAFSYIQPEWTIGERGTGAGLKSVLFHQGDDYHPPGNVCAGDSLVRKVYESLIANRAAWEKTLLIITFDEPVGSFDHVPPPKATPPWGDNKPDNIHCEKDFPFDRYGGRVPAILVSPMIEKSTVFRSDIKAPYDHTSIISSVLRWQGLDSLIPEFGARTAAAPHFLNVLTRETPRTDERDVPFMQQARKLGQPVRFYDRFRLRAADGRYLTRFKEGSVAPFSIFADDPSMTEYFPTFAYPKSLGVDERTVLFAQNAANRPDNGQLGAGAQAVKIVAADYGLGSYCVLGAWADSHDCYYSNDYLEGDNNGKQLWKIEKTTSGPVCFGDKVTIRNQYHRYFGQALRPDGEYLTTANGDAFQWTVEPLEADVPAANALRLGARYYLRHKQSGRYLGNVHKGAQWYPTLGQSTARIQLTLRAASTESAKPPIFCDGMSCELVSTEDLSARGQRCDVLMAWTNPYLYYYYNDYSRDYQQWVLSLASGGGPLTSGAELRLINRGYGQFMAPKGDYLTTVADETADCIWVLEQV